MLRQSLVTFGCASLLVHAAVGAALGQGVYPDVGQALHNYVVESAARLGERQPPPPAEPALPAPELSTHVADFVLSGVVITAARRVALLQDPAANPGGVRFLAVGATLAGHRLIDVQEDNVTFEGRGGERTIVRLGAGGELRQGPSALRQGVSRADEPRSVKEKEERQARRIRQNAEEKLRALVGERGAGMDQAPRSIRER